MRAYNAAKDKLKSKHSFGDDYVSKAEFKYFLLYLRQYYEYWMAFDSIDTSNDRRITEEEFKFALPVLQKWGIQVTDPVKIFKEIDTNNGGFILFDEFCKWAVQKGIDASSWNRSKMIFDLNLLDERDEHIFTNFKLFYQLRD